MDLRAPPSSTPDSEGASWGGRIHITNPSAGLLGSNVFCRPWRLPHARASAFEEGLLERDEAERDGRNLYICSEGDRARRDRP